MSEPERKRVDEDELAWTAKGADVEEIVESMTVATREKLSELSAKGDTVLQAPVSHLSFSTLSIS